MKIEALPHNFTCPANIKPHLEKVLLGEYDVPLFMPVPRILDLGANCGAFSVWASHRWPGCTIEAYEPHPENFTYLERNLANYPNVTLHNYAIGNPGWRILGNGLFNQGEASLHEIDNNPLPTGQHVEVRSPLELPEADILKMDIEGSEIEVLPALIEAGRYFKAICYEYHSERIRRHLDALLGDYKLVRAEVLHPDGRGTFCFLHKEIVL